MIAGISTGIFPDLTTALKELITIKEVIDPEPEWTRYYDDMFPLFKEMYAALDEPLKELQLKKSSIRCL